MEKVLVIAGPTGVGKTSLSIELAKRLHGEIISGDSMQVYREMNIGTAKIRKEEMEHIPHHLIDAYSLAEEYNVKLFQKRSRDLIQDIHKRGAMPILCGGTGLYIKSCLYDYEFLEQEEDASFMEFLKQRSNDELWGLLQIVDPKVTKILHPNNRQRIIRALYMAHMGKKKSEILKEQQHQPIYDAYIIGLTMNREHLYERINQRVDKMMEEGLLDEIEQLVKQYDDIWELQSFQGIGYKEWKSYVLDGVSKEECVELIKKNSRNFAKRQYTWFRNQMNVHWYDIEDNDYPQQLYEDIKKWMEH